jgi:cyanophycinase-like exopeptidase
MEPVVAAHPELLGIGIDPNTVIVVKGDQLEVIGMGKVPITGARQPQFSIAIGSRFDLRTRKPLWLDSRMNRIPAYPTPQGPRRRQLDPIFQRPRTHLFA